MTERVSEDIMHYQAIVKNKTYFDILTNTLVPWDDSKDEISEHTYSRLVDLFTKYANNEIVLEVRLTVTYNKENEG